MNFLRNPRLFVVSDLAGNYGRDLGVNFYSLLKDIVKIEGLYRLRISSIEMNEVTDELIQLIKPEPFIYSTSLIILVIGIIVGTVGSASAVKKYLKI